MNIQDKLKQSEKACILKREEALDFDLKHNGNFHTANGLSIILSFISYLLDTTDERSFEDWWENT